MAPKLWLRAETKPGEARSALTPRDAKTLLEAGFDVVVERSPQAAIPVAEFAACGCQLAAAGSWRESPIDTIRCGAPSSVSITIACHAPVSRARTIATTRVGGSAGS